MGVRSGGWLGSGLRMTAFELLLWERSSAAAMWYLLWREGGTDVLGVEMPRLR